MLRTLRRLLEGGQDAQPAYERRHLQLAVAVLLHEARRADYDETDVEEAAAAQSALAEMFGLDKEECAALLKEGREKAQEQNSFYAPVAAIKREWGLPERATLIEHLWRVSYADGELKLYEDHYVRKIAHLLYLPNTDIMLARNRARDHK